MNSKDLFKPYLSEMHKRRYTDFRFCIPKKYWFINKEIVYICPRCAFPMINGSESHCTTSSNIKISIIKIENWFLTEINDNESNKIHFTDKKANRMELINFLEVNYGYMQCNEPLLIIDSKLN